MLKGVHNMTKEKPTYRVLMAELTQLLSDMQSSELDVDQAVEKYQRGQKLIKQLSAYLVLAENQIIVHKSDTI
jgi:exodeoxyribonuclease VII small subunit